MSCESGPSKFQAAGVFAVWGDEEFQPSGLEIFNEIYSRIDPGQKLHIFLTFTPLQGYSWSYRRLWDPDDEIYLKGPGGVDNVVERFCFNLYDCDKNRGGFWETEDIERQIAAYHEYEKQARVFGQYSRIGGRPFFSPNQIIEAEKKAPKGKKARITIDALKQTRIEWTENGSWTVYEERKDNERYFMGIDVSGGSRRDRSVCYVIKRGTRERVARLKSDSIDAGRLAQFYAFPAARYYNNAVVIPEINGEFGGAFVTTLKRFYQRIWSDTQWDRLKEQRRTQIGWRTNDVTRGILLTVVEKALREEWPCFTDTCCHELMSILTKKSRDGKEKVEHADGCFDDEFFAMALALAVHEMRPMMKPFELEKGGEIYEDDPYLTAGMTG